MQGASTFRLKPPRRIGRASRVENNPSKGSPIIIQIPKNRTSFFCGEAGADNHNNFGFDSKNVLWYHVIQGCKTCSSNAKSTPFLRDKRRIPFARPSGMPIRTPNALGCRRAMASSICENHYRGVTFRSVACKQSVVNLSPFNLSTFQPFNHSTMNEPSVSRVRHGGQHDGRGHPGGRRPHPRPAFCEL